MNRLQLHEKWLTDILPDGLPYPTSTLISGPGGSGKPLIGFAFVYSWLQAGGNVVFITLQYPEMDFVKTSLKRLYDLDITEYQERIAYIQFNYDLESWQKKGSDIIQANLLKPGIWEEAVDEAENTLIEDRELGTLVFASALNLLLFSPIYRQPNVEKLEKLLQEDKSRTYIFSVSTSAYEEEIEKWERAADNLMFARMEKPMKLYLSIEKMENKAISVNEVLVPLEREILEEIKEVAESVRKRDIPRLIKI